MLDNDECGPLGMLPPALHQSRGAFHRAVAGQMKKDLLAFDEDIKNFKAWLKDLWHRPRMAGFDDTPF